MGAYLHDLGKVRVPHEILNKPGRARPPRSSRSSSSIRCGASSCSRPSSSPGTSSRSSSWHHERYDGNGYPDRLRGDEIPLGAQIICIVDVYDALTTTRSYRGALSQAEAVDRMVAVAALVAHRRVRSLHGVAARAVRGGLRRTNMLLAGAALAAVCGCADRRPTAGTATRWSSRRRSSRPASFRRWSTRPSGGTSATSCSSDSSSSPTGCADRLDRLPSGPRGAVGAGGLAHLALPSAPRCPVA